MAPDRALARRRMGRLHHRLLYVIGHNPGIDVGQTAALLGISGQAAHGPLRDLKAADMVRAEVSPEDRRRKRLVLTAAGRRFERRLADMQHRAFREAFGAAGANAEAGWRTVMDALARGRRLRVPAGS